MAGEETPVAGRHTCPRRLEQYRAAGEQNIDLWESRHGLSGQDSAGLSCSYCGSLHPDRFLELVRDGWWVDPTDKAYKAYLARPLSGEQVAAEKQRWLSGTLAATIRDAVGRDRAAVEAAIDAEWQEMPAAAGHGQVMAKFYYQHLSVAQQDEFIDLVNTKTMRIGIPGHFYVLPFFARPRTVGVDGRGTS